MFTPRLTDCIECTDITSLLSDIECKVTDIAKDLYNNTIFALNRPISGDIMFDLLTYKRILTYRICNPDYANGVKYTTSKIISRVKLLKYK